MMKLIPYQPSFLSSCIEWRGQPLSLRHNPLQDATKEDIAKLLESECSDLSDLRRHESCRWFVECDDATVGSVALKNISHTMR
jgi:hypothetical protein